MNRPIVLLIGILMAFGHHSASAQDRKNTTALAQPPNWTAKWIQVGYGEPVENRPVQYFGKGFSLMGKVKHARLLITSHGLYEAQLNGARVGDVYLTPGWTAYKKRLQYQEYEVTAMLAKGENRLAVALGDGWYRGHIGWMNQFDVYGNTLALLCQLEISYADGKKETIVSDESWTCGQGPIRASEINNGETIDANRTVVCDKAVKLANYGYAELVPNDGVSLKKHETFLPVKVITTPKGETVLDFGQNLTGWVMFKLKGSKGDTVRLAHGEVLDKAGNFYMENMRTARTVCTYILSGKGEESFEPHFTYFGFRYVRVTGLREKIMPADFTAVALYADMKPTGVFECSNPMLNQLHSNIVWGQKGNFTEVPTDCPQRDEKLGWTGDAQAFCRTATFNFDVRAFFSKWLKDLVLEQLPSGVVTHVVPDILSGAGGSAGWSDAATVVPWTMYEVYGDKELLERQYPSMKKWVEYIRSQAKNNLWNTGLHYGDWLSYRSTANREYTAHTDMYLIAQAFYAHSTELLFRSAEVLGKSEDVKVYSTLLSDIKKAFCEEYVSPLGMVSSNTQTAYVLALQFDLLPEDKRAEAARRLVKNIEFYKDHITTGFIGTPYICHVLSRFGYADVAYRLLLQETYPSWLYPVKMGATTIWERWDGIRPDGSLQNPQMNSFNHYAYGAVGDWMYQNILGIQCTVPGFKKIVIKPLMGGGLTWAKGSYVSASGKIAVGWKVEGGRFTLDAEIPSGTTAEVWLPYSKAVKALGPGKYSFTEDVPPKDKG